MSKEKFVQQQDAFDDAFHYVCDYTNLTHHNVQYLMREAFKKAGIVNDTGYDALSDKSQVDVCVINEDAAAGIDYNLRDAVLKFIAYGKDKASFALCRGHLENRQIVGNTHWTALHLRRVDKGDGKFFIQSYYMDSLGRDGDIHPAVQRILSNITITDLASDGLKETDMFKTRLPEQMRQYQTQSCQTLACPRQEDGYSCGYHAVFNLARVHAAREVKAGETLAQDGVEVNAQRFIADRKRDLIQSFSSRVAAGFTQKSHNQLLEILNSTSAYHEKLESLPPLGIIDEQARRIYRKIIADFAESWYFQLNHDKEVPNKSAAMKFFDDLVRIRFDSKDDMPAVKEMVSEISQRPSDFLNNPAQILIPCQKQINQILAKQASSERHGSDRRDRKPFSGSDDRHKKRAGSRDEEKSERVRVDSGARYPKPKSPQHRKLYVELRQEPVAYQKPKSSDLMLEGYKVDDKKVMLHYRKKSDKSEVVEELPKGPQWKVDGDKVVVTEKYAKDIWKFYFHQKKGELPKSGRPAAMSEHDIEENHTSETLPPVVIKLISVKALNDNSRSH